MILWMQQNLSSPKLKHDHTDHTRVVLTDDEGKNEDLQNLLHDMHAKMDHVIEALENNEVANGLQGSLPAPESIASSMHIGPIAFIDRHEARGECTNHV